MKAIDRFCIENIYIKEFKDIKECKINSIPVNAPWIFLTGENGKGKTVFLQAIATGLHPIDNIINETQSDIGENGSILIKIYGGDPYGVLRNNEGILQFIGLKNFIIISCYGPSRLQTLTESGQNERVGSVPGLSRLFGDHTFLKNIDFELIKWELKKDSSQIITEEKNKIKAKLNFTKRLLIEMLDLDNIIIDVSNDKVFYKEKGTDDSVLEGVRSFELGAGYRNLLGFVGDMILNLSTLQEEIIDPSQLYGIVIIDEIELHLHPKLQKSLPGILSKYFPLIQFIASTHSPIPLLGAPEGSVFLKVDRTKEDGIVISRLEKLEKEIKYLQPNAVFSSDIFDFDNIESSQIEDISDIRSEDHYRDIEVNDKIREKLKSLDDKSIFPENLFTKD